jgi:hypothetical protein
MTISQDFIVSIPDNKHVGIKIVRAFATSEEVQTKYGIGANFSCNLVSLDTEGRQVGRPIASINSLMLKFDREGFMYISSKGEHYTASKTNKDGKQETYSNVVYPFTFFPGAMRTEKTAELYDDFVEQVSNAVENFIQHARSRNENGYNNVPLVVERIRSIKK